MSSEINEPNIVIVGGGPVGLWTAIQIRKHSSDIQVVILERHEQYVRSHVLRLDQLSLLLYCKHSRDPREREFYEEVMGGSSKLNPANRVYVRTNVLEAALRRYAVDLGVSVKIAEMQSPDEVESLYPNADCFIAADGARSRMRRALLSGDDTESRTLQHIVELKYEAQGGPRFLQFAREGFKTQKILNFMTFEYVGKAIQGNSAITLRLFVDRNTFDAVSEATFKAPLLLESESLPPRLAHDIRTYLNIRKELTHEEYVVGSGKITKIILTAYRARRFSIHHNQHTWFFVGDAAMGIPYFRALNCGLLCSSLLSRICVRLHRNQISVRVASAMYNWFATMRYLTERFIAWMKNLMLQFVDFYRRFGARVPWQTTKWSSDEAFRYETQGHRAFGERS